MSHRGGDWTCLFGSEEPWERGVICLKTSEELLGRMIGILLTSGRQGQQVGFRKQPSAGSRTTSDNVRAPRHRGVGGGAGVLAAPGRHQPWEGAGTVNL